MHGPISDIIIFGALSMNSHSVLMSQVCWVIDVVSFRYDLYEMPVLMVFSIPVDRAYG